jgi:hypothetical protein
MLLPKRLCSSGRRASGGYLICPLCSNMSTL